jgi:AraC family ethanolamine operon transcriptional activator
MYQRRISASLDPEFEAEGRSTRTDVMAIGELADHLGLSKARLHELAREGNLPASRVGNRWRFDREALERWRGARPEIPRSPARSAEAAAQFVSAKSFDIEDLVQLVWPWEVRFTQLSSGKFHGTLEAVRTPHMVIYEERWLRRVLARGATPPGLVMIGTNAAWQRSRVDWCGGTLDSRRFACSRPGSEVGFEVPDRSHHAVLLVQPELLARSAGRETVDLLCDRKHVNLHPMHGSRLVATLGRVVRKYSARPELLRDPFEVRCLESSLLDVLGTCIARGSLQDTAESSSSRRAAVERAIEYVDCSVGPITALELAIAVGVSQRTLEYCFRNVLGTTPAAYLRLHRLNQAHRDLAAADPQASTVTEIAMKRGFSHAGRFSVAHRRLFGVTPSETLRTARPPLVIGQLTTTS